MNTHRLQLLLDDETYATLLHIRERRETTFVAIVRRAVKMLKYAMDTQDAGGSLRLYDKNGILVQKLEIK